MPRLIDGKQSDGLTCPRCKLRLRTRRTLPQPDGTVERVKWCPKCNGKWVTVELPKCAKPKPGAT